MAQNLITDLAYRKLKATEKEQVIADGAGLYIRVRAKNTGGAISFRLAYRVDGKQRWITLKSKTLAEARKESSAYKAMVLQGTDPSLERKLVIERKRQAQITEQAEAAKLAALTTVNSLYHRWIEISVKDRKDLPEIKRMLEKDVLPIIGGLVVVDVRKGHITEFVDKLILRDAKHTARNILKLVRQMFRFAVDRDLIEFDPTAGLSITKVTTKPTERDRVLNDSEIRALARQIPAAGLILSTEAAIWIMLSTCCRVGELSRVKLEHVDLNGGTWIIPSEHSKNGKQHTVYLSDFACTRFETLFNVTQSGVWLLPNRNNNGHVCDKSLSKQIDSRQNDAIQTHRSKLNTSLVLSGGKWTPHDLRRSGATLMGNLGISPDVIEKCLNHSEENKVKRIYQRQELKAEQAEAWRLLGDRLELLTSNSDNVIPINKRA